MTNIWNNNQQTLTDSNNKCEQIVRNTTLPFLHAKKYPHDNFYLTAYLNSTRGSPHVVPFFGGSWDCKFAPSLAATLHKGTANLQGNSSFSGDQCQGKGADLQSKTMQICSRIRCKVAVP
eukprot:158599-Amphidinium_carterae.1